MGRRAAARGDSAGNRQSARETRLGYSGFRLMRRIALGATLARNRLCWLGAHGKIIAYTSTSLAYWEYVR